MIYQSPAHELVGAVLNGRWRLTRLLGEGGMGSVYEAEGMRGEGKRAIKLLHQEFVREQAVLHRFLTEATATRQLTHPNVAHVLDAATAEDGTPYIVMELLVGVSLGGAMEKGRGMPPQQAAPIVWGILQALVAAHAMRLVHRDLKPDNIFLVRDGRGQYVPKLLDFGIAKVMDAAGGMGSKTRTGVLLGTPGYMSPEQIRNSKGVDPRSDLWSIGVIFYELLAGTSPFPADNEFARLTAVLTEEVKPIERYGQGLASWNGFFARAIAKDANQRFQSAEEMARALSVVANGGSAPGADWTSVSLPSQMPPSVPPGTMQPGMQTAPHRTFPSSPAAPPKSPPTQIQGMGIQISDQPTHVSALKPAGTPTLSQASPSVAIVDAPPVRRERGGAAWWLVVLLCLMCTGAGFAAGFIAARG